MRPFTLFAHYREHYFSYIYSYPSFCIKLCIIILTHVLKILRRNRISRRLEVWSQVIGLIVCEFCYTNEQIVKNCLFHGKIHVKNKYWCHWDRNKYVGFSGTKDQIRNQRFKKPPSAKLHPNQGTFCILVSHIWSAILNL